jgi:hypothetical protein
MSSKKNKGRRHRSQTTQAPRPPSIKPPENRGCFWWILALSTIAGGVAAILFFYPRPTISDSEPIEPQFALSASFTVTNNGFIPLEDVNVGLALGKLVMAGSSANTPLEEAKPVTYSTIIEHVRWAHHYLPMDDKFTITPSELFHNTSALGFGRIGINVRYKPWFLPFQRNKLFKFRTFTQEDGKIVWYHDSSN